MVLVCKKEEIASRLEQDYALADSKVREAEAELSGASEMDPDLRLALEEKIRDLKEARDAAEARCLLWDDLMSIQPASGDTPERILRVLLQESSRGHRYLVGGMGIAPGVTTIINSVVAKPQLIAWSARSAVNYLKEVLERGDEISEEDLECARKSYMNISADAMSMGSVVHRVISGTLSGDVDEIGIFDVPCDAIPPLRKWAGWWRRSELVPVMVEFPVASSLGWGGTVDCLARDPMGRNIIIDWKVSRKHYKEYQMQVSAYAAAVEETFGLRVDGAVVVRIEKDAGDIVPLEITRMELHRGIRVMTNLLEVWKWFKEVEHPGLSDVRIEEERNEIELDPIYKVLKKGYVHYFYSPDGKKVKVRRTPVSKHRLTRNWMMRNGGCVVCGTLPAEGKELEWTDCVMELSRHNHHVLVDVCERCGLHSVYSVVNAIRNMDWESSLDKMPFIQRNRLNTAKEMAKWRRKVRRRRKLDPSDDDGPQYNLLSSSEMGYYPACQLLRLRGGIRDLDTGELLRPISADGNIQVDGEDTRSSGARGKGSTEKSKVGKSKKR